MVTVLWDGNKLILSQPDRPSTVYPELNRLCSKLEHRGFQIEHTGKGNIRHAIPVNPKYAHPKDTFKVGVPIEVNA